MKSQVKVKTMELLSANSRIGNYLLKSKPFMVLQPHCRAEVEASVVDEVYSVPCVVQQGVVEVEPNHTLRELRYDR